MSETNARRASDGEIRNLIDRVESLEREVAIFREDFAKHESDEHLRLDEMQITLKLIQVKIDQLMIDIKEPIEAYKTAKYGMTFVKFVVETAKWLAPLIVGLTLGYAVLSKGDDQPVKAQPTEQTK